MITAEVVESLKFRRIFGVNDRGINPEFGLRFSKNIEYKPIVLKTDLNVQLQLSLASSI